MAPGLAITGYPKLSGDEGFAPTVDRDTIADKLPYKISLFFTNPKSLPHQDSKEKIWDGRWPTRVGPRGNLL